MLSATDSLKSQLQDGTPAVPSVLSCASASTAAARTVASVGVHRISEFLMAANAVSDDCGAPPLMDSDRAHGGLFTDRLGFRARGVRKPCPPENAIPAGYWRFGAASAHESGGEEGGRDNSGQDHAFRADPDPSVPGEEDIETPVQAARR